ncbi:MAG: metal-sulfur cluster assembly factor [Muribaculaceae bacterium]|nr:metal-sulfur cluster assembly factor [Muribaculaceae bacterium]
MENTEDIKKSEGADVKSAETSIGENKEDAALSVEERTAEELRITEKARDMLRTVFDPEIPVNVYDLGLIYKIDYEVDTKTLHVDMTLTAPSCPAADFILEDVRQKLVSIKGPEKVDLRLVFDPVWDQSMMSEEAKLELGFL